MSETPIVDDPNTNIHEAEINDDASFLRRAGKGALALGLVAGAAGLGAGAATVTEQLQDSAAASVIEIEKAHEAQQLTALDENLNATYPVESVIGEITIPEYGSTIEGEVRGVLGDNITADDYDVFLRSAQNQGSVQPGQSFSIVKADVDNNTTNGDETFVVKQTQVNHGVATELPTPETH